MNWIDKIFKDQLGSRKFPDALRDKGKADLEFLLAREMPVAAAKAGKGGLFYGGLSVLIVALIAIPAGIWYFQQQDKAEVNQPEYSINFGQPSAETITAVVENKVGTSGSWNVVDNTAELQAIEPEEATDLAQDGKGIVRTEAPNILELTNDRTVAAQPPVRNSNKILEKSNEVNATLANANYKEGRKSVLQTSNENDEADGIKEANEPKAMAANHIEEVETDAASKDVSESSANSLQSSTIMVADNADAKSEDVGESEDGGLNSTQPVAGATEGESNKVVAEKAENTTIVNQMEGEESVNPIDSKKQTPQEAEGASTAINEETASKTEGQAESSKPTSNLQLSNLAFSDLGGGSGADISQYKSLSPKRMAISLWGGYTYVGKTINGGAPDYLNIRKEKEDAIWTLPTGLTFDYYLTNKWTLSVGAGFSEYGEVLNYDYEYEREGYEDGRYGSPNNYNGITRLDSVRVITGINQGHWDYYFDYTESDTMIKNNNGQTHWSYVEIPVMVGYRFGSGKLKPWLQGGLALGIPYNQTFRYISASGDGLQTLEDSRTSASDLQFSGQLSVGVDYYLTPHFSLRLNGFGSYQFTPAYKFEGIEQRYYRLGVTIGLAYNF